MQLTMTDSRMSAERALIQAGVVDVETASLLLSKRLDFAEPVDNEQITSQVEQLLIDKPFLQRPSHEIGSMPPKSASPKDSHTSTAAQLANAAQQAIKSGNRRDIAEYLRLRRQTSLAGSGPTGM